MALENGAVTSPEVYVHQINRLRHAALDDLYAAVRDEFVPAMEQLGARLLGYWSAVPEQGNWPETIEIWEYDNMAHCGSVIRARESGAAEGQALRDWLRRRSDWVAETHGLICTRSEGSPSVADLRASGLRAAVTLHETISVRTARQREYVDLVDAFMKPRIMDPLGRRLIGMFYSPNWSARQVFNLWAVAETWPEFTPINMARPDRRDTETWRALAPQIRDDYFDRFLVPAPFSPIA
jgi:hypothetical protein